MNTMKASTLDEWESALQNRLSSYDQRGGFIFYLPDARPDLALKLARKFDYDFVDYQQHIALALGRDAYFLTLSRLDEIIANLTLQKGIVLYNVETLLCWKTPSERRAWLSRFLITPWANPVVLALVPCG
ncbi:MAG: hypothetical protein ACFCUG_07100 [Thiotrichales bacterium]